MLIDLLVASPWLVALLWAFLSIFDFSATMLFSKMYRDFLSNTVHYERGVEMNPHFEKDVQQVKWFNPRYIFLMLGFTLLLGITGSWFPSGVFELVAGTALLLLLVVDFRHIENLSLAWFLKIDPDGIKGKIEQSYKMSQQRVAVYTFNAGALYLIVFLLTGRVFFLGGTIVSVLLSLRQFLLSRKKLPKQSSSV